MRDPDGRERGDRADGRLMAVRGRLHNQRACEIELPRLNLRALLSIRPDFPGLDGPGDHPEQRVRPRRSMPAQFEPQRRISPLEFAEQMSPFILQLSFRDPDWRDPADRPNFAAVERI